MYHQTVLARAVSLKTYRSKPVLATSSSLEIVVIKLKGSAGHATLRVVRALVEVAPNKLVYTQLPGI